MSTWAKIKHLIPSRRTAAEQEMEAELQSIALLAEADGNRRHIGNLTRAAEESRSVWTWVWLEQFLTDVRYTSRTARKSPMFTLTAVISLALGIGANTAIFSLINAVMLKSLPVPHPERLVVLTSHSHNGKVGDFGYQDYLALRDETTAFAGIMASSRTAAAVAGVGPEADTVQRKIVSCNYFSILGLRPAAGRFFQDREDDLQVAVISSGLWKRAFGGVSNVVGRTIDLEGKSFEIVGVAPPEFFSETAGESVDVWTTVALMPGDMKRAPGFTWLYLMGRLLPGVSHEQAQAALHSRIPQVLNRFIARVEIEPGRSGGAGLRNTFGSPLRVLMGIVMVALLMACANLAALLLTRAASRKREIATRLAIGAGLGRIFRQFITESLILAFLGGVLGLALAIWGQSILLKMIADLGRTVTLDLRPDPAVLLFTLFISFVTGILFGLMPACEALGKPTRESLNMGASHRPGRGSRIITMRGGLVAFQIALSMALLFVGSLFIQTLRNLRNQNIGIATANVISVRLEGRRGDRFDWPSVVSELQRRLVALSDVQAASGSLFGTLANAGGVTGFRVEGYVAPDQEEQRAGANWVTPQYFETVGISLLRGRDFTVQDDPRSPRVAIVNQAMARHYFSGDERAVGRYFVLNDHKYEIIGVARDAKYNDLRESGRRFIYFPALQGQQEIRSLEVRTRSARPEIASDVRQILSQINPRLRVADATTIERRISQKVAREVLIANLATFFGVLTLVLVVIGGYGMLAYSVALRTKEFGIRIALGGHLHGIARTVLRELSMALLIGLACGLALALLAGRVVSSMVWGLRSTDPVTITTTALILVIAMALASLAPVYRAWRIDPLKALRLE